MKTNSKITAIFLSTAIWADGEYSDTERNTLHEIAADFEQDSLVEDVQECIKKIVNLSAEDLSEKLAEAARQVVPEEKDGILALCLQLMGCDSYLAKEEINNFFVLAKILGIKESRAHEILAELVEEKVL